MYLIEITLVSHSYTNDIHIEQESINYNDHPSDDPVSLKNQKQEKEKNNYQEKFKIWWKVYPRKVAKKTAQKKFISLKPDDTLFEKMMSALKTLIENKQNSVGELD